MSQVLQDSSTTSIISSIEGNLFGMFSCFRKWPRAEVHDEAEMMWSMTDIPFPLFNCVLRAQLVPEKVDAAVQAIIVQARSRNVPLLWWTGPATRPSDLGAHLETHGFISEGQIPGMAIDLAKLGEDQPTPAGLTVQVARDKETLRQWSQVCAMGFGMPEFVGEAFCDLMGYVDADIALAYLGWQNGRPVATSLLLLAAGVAGIYNVATIPEARRQGIGAALTLAPLRDARDRKYKVGILQASEMGVDVYRSLGFQEYCKVGQYVWSPEQKQGAG